MADIADSNKENFAPLSSTSPLHHPSPAKPLPPTRRGRSKSIGPGDLPSSTPGSGSNSNIDNTIPATSKLRNAKNRRKSTYVPATKAIISADAEKAERQAARRRTLANRRVSFAPEATLHTWDVVEFMRDPTTSTTTEGDGERTARSAGGARVESLLKRRDGEGEEEQEGEEVEEEGRMFSSPAPRRDGSKKRRASGVPPLDFSDATDDPQSSPAIGSGSSGSSGSDNDDDNENDGSGSEDGEEGSLDDETGTAMSLDLGNDNNNNTIHSLTGSDVSGSTGSSARLEAALQQAAHAAGTRGIEYDEYGEMSMEMAGDEVINAFKPWAERVAVGGVGSHQLQAQRSAELDQEHVNPFSPAFKAQMKAGEVLLPATTQEQEDTEDVSMDATRAVGGIISNSNSIKPPSSSPLLSDGSMEFTRAIIGKIHASASSPAQIRSTAIAGAAASNIGQKRRRSTTDAGSPGALPGHSGNTNGNKRRRSSAARSSMGEGSDTMDLTIPAGGIQTQSQNEPTDSASSSSAKAGRKGKGAGVRRRSEGAASDASFSAELDRGDATMDFTRAVGGISRASGGGEGLATTPAEADKNLVENDEELSVELTAALGGILSSVALPAVSTLADGESRRLKTPSPRGMGVLGLRGTATPKDQERFLSVDDQGPGRLLTPVLKMQAARSAEKDVKLSEGRRILRSAGAAAANRKGTASASPVARMKQAQATPAMTPDDLDGNSAFVSPSGSPSKSTVTSGRVSRLDERESPARFTPDRGMAVPAQSTPQSQLEELLAAQLQASHPSPTLQKQLRRSPAVHTSTPQKAESSQEPPTLADSIKLMSTPRKETLKNLTPKKQLPPSTHATPLRPATPRASRPTPRSAAKSSRLSPSKQLQDELLQLRTDDQPTEKVHLQAFLEQAGIRFMDLTTTKRRLTIAPTPSRTRRHDSNSTHRSSSTNTPESSEPAITLQSAVVAKACTHPEFEMFSHACYELKRYIADGKRETKALEAAMYEATPALVRVYQRASDERRVGLDAQMREMKTQARLRSRELWYKWRSELLDGLVEALAGIGEGLIRDDEILSKGEGVLEEVLPGLVGLREKLGGEVQELEVEAAEAEEVVPEEKEELALARERLEDVNAEMERKRATLWELRAQMQEQEQEASDLQESRAEFVAAIQEADRVRDACRGISLDEIAALQASVNELEAQHGWSLTSASSFPLTVTLAYKSQLQLFFHPAAFQSLANPPSTIPTNNSPISLTYLLPTKNPSHSQPDVLPTTLRFFLQLLRAALQALPQHRTRVPALLALVSRVWETAVAVREAERRLSIEGPTRTRIVSDERLSVECSVLDLARRGKVQVGFEVLAAGLGDGERVQVHMRVERIYGAGGPGEREMEEAVKGCVQGVVGWGEGIRMLRNWLEDGVKVEGKMTR